MQAIEYGSTTLRLKSMWTSCASIVDLARCQLPKSERAVIIADESLSLDLLSALEGQIARQGTLIGSFRYAASQKDVCLLHSIADDLQRERSDLVYLLGGGTLCDVGGPTRRRNYALPVVEVCGLSE